MSGEIVEACTSWLRHYHLRKEYTFLGALGIQIDRYSIVNVLCETYQNQFIAVLLGIFCPCFYIYLEYGELCLRVSGDYCATADL